MFVSCSSINSKNSENQFKNQIDGSATYSNKDSSKFYYLFGAECLNLDNVYFDIPVVYNPRVQEWIDYFTGKGRVYFERYLERSKKHSIEIGDLLEKKQCS